MNVRDIGRWSVSVAAAAAAVIAFPLLALGQEDQAQQVEYSAEDMKDPFKPAFVKDIKTDEAKPVVAVEVKPLPEMTVQGVFWGGQFPQAIVNNKVVREGDSIEDATVLAITRTGIRFRFANREFTVAQTPAGGKTNVLK